MWLYIARRLLLAIPIALGVSVICFSLIYFAPGSEIDALLPPDATAADAAYLSKLYGLDQPPPIQYLHWLERALRGDLGVSLVTHRPVLTEVATALSNTVVISLGAAFLAFSFAIILGTIAAYNLGRPVDRLVTGVAVVGVSIPNYWLAIVLIIIFAVELRVLPATGMGSQESLSLRALSWQQMKYAILPIVAMAVAPLGIIMRSTRSAVAEVLSNDFVQALYAKGLGEFAILRHALRNALPQVLAVMGLQFGQLVGGSILVETIFTWPGAGYLLNNAILTRDVPLLQGAILVLALAFVGINLVVDLLQTNFDPRMKRT